MLLRQPRQDKALPELSHSRPLHAAIGHPAPQQSVTSTHRSPLRAHVQDHRLPRFAPSLAYTRGHASCPPHRRLLSTSVSRAAASPVLSFRSYHR
jgi:hypothetical protein